MTRLSRGGLDFYDAVRDLGHFQREQLLHQARVGTRQGDRRTAVALPDMQDVAAQPLAVHVPLTRDLLRRRQDRLQLAKIHQHGPGIPALLDHPGHDIALAARVFAEGQLVLGITEPLQDHLPCGGGGDPAEAVRRVVILPDYFAVIARFPGPDSYVAAAPVHLDPCRRRRAVAAVVGDKQRVLDRLDGQVHRDVLLGLQAAQDIKVNVHLSLRPRRRARRRRPARRRD